MLDCRTKTLTASWLMLALCVSAIQGQQPISGQQQLPGGHFRGRYLGFQPKYGQVPAPVPPHRRSPSAPASEVAQTNYETVMTDGATMVDGSMMIDQGVPYDSAGACSAPVSAVANVWGSAEYLIFWTKGMTTPALATTSPTGTAQEDAGVLGVRTTDILFGDEEFGDGSRSGGRFTLGFWLSPYQRRALELSYLNLDSEENGFSASNADFGILARPFFDTQASAEDSRLITFPNLVEGSLNIDVSTQFDTAEVLVRTPTSRCNGCLDYFFGYRFAQLEDSLTFRESTLSLSGPTQDASFLLTDAFETENEFHGGQLGVQFSSQSSPLWSMDIAAKIALGNTRSRVFNSGLTRITDPTGATSVQNSGLLVQRTNAGTFESDEFSTITEIGVTLHRHITCNVALNVGYTFFLWTDVVRAGDNLDTTVNTSQIPPGTLTGEARPAVNNETTDFWAQGLRLGLEARF